MKNCEATLLTARGVRELRKADAVAFHLREFDSDFGECWINAELARDPDINLRVDCNAIVTSYNGARNNGFAMIHGSKNSPEWHTFAKLLRPNDKIRLHWIASDNNGYLKDVDLHHDFLRGEIWRKDKLAYSLILASSTCPENAARMARP